MDFNTIVEWLKQPSTLKFLVTIAGSVGFVISPDQLEKIIAAVLVVQSLINGFYDHNPRKPQ